ncbi:hypothetical protein ACOMD2_08550, partial [Hominicoprocola fusiformis]
HAPFLLLGFMFQLIARHLLHTLNIIVVESFTTPRHYCPMSVQPLPVLTVTTKRSFGIGSTTILNNEKVASRNNVRQPFC